MMAASSVAVVLYKTVSHVSKTTLASPEDITEDISMTCGKHTISS